MIKYITIGTEEKIEVTLVQSTGLLLDNSSPKLSIRRLGDNKFFDFGGGSGWLSFDGGTTLNFEDRCEVTMTQPNIEYLPGKYSYLIDFSAQHFGIPQTYVFRARDESAANSPLEGEVKTQYVSFDEAISTLEDSEIHVADYDIVERKVQRGMPSEILKRLSDKYWLRILLWYDYTGGQVIRSVSEVINREENI